MLAPHDDLLQPALDQSHDAEGLREPFDPSSLPYVVFFCGPLCGGAIAAWNWLRLGVRGQFTKTLLMFAALWLAIGVAGYYAVAEKSLREAQRTGEAPTVATTKELQPPGELRDQRTGLFRFLAQVVAVVPALWVANRQKQRFRIHQQTEGRTASLARYGVAAFVLNVALMLFAYPALWAGMFTLHGA